MVEQLMETVKTIIVSGFPKDTNGNSVVYGKAIQQFYFGDNTISAANDPSVVFIATSSEPKDTLGFGAKEITHKLKVAVYTRRDTIEKSNRAVFEMARLIYEVLLPHRLMWVMNACPICQLKILTPAHFTIVHSSILSPYITAAQATYNSTWAETHLSGDTAPTLPQSGLAADAFLLMTNDVINNVTVSGLSSSAIANIKSNANLFKRPIRLMFDVVLDSLQEDPLTKEFLISASFSLTAKEVIIQPAYGPDNVLTGTFQL